VPYIRDLSKKQAVTNQSLQKIEDGRSLALNFLAAAHIFPACYAIVVRGSEYDLPPEKLDELVAQILSNYSNQKHLEYNHIEGGGKDGEFISI
jgi:hypothetical protein